MKFLGKLLLVCTCIPLFAQGVAGQAGAYPQPSGAGATNVINAVNVKAAPYNALGDTHKIIDGVVAGPTSTISSPSYNFTQADVGKLIWCVNIPGGVGALYVPYGPTNGGSTTPPAITSVSAGVATYGANAVGGAGPYPTQACVWGHDDTAAIVAAANAAAANQNVAAPPSNVNGPTLAYISNVYIPAGGYMLASRPFNWIVGSTQQIPGILGDGMEKSVFFMRPDWPTGGYVGNEGVFGNFAGVGGDYANWSVDGAGFLFGFSNVNLTRWHTNTGSIRNVRLANLCNNATFFDWYMDGTTAMPMFNPQAHSNECSPSSLTGGFLFIGTAEMTVHSILSSNTVQNLYINSIIGGNSTQGIEFFGGFVDEGGGASCAANGLAASSACVIAAKDVDFIGTVMLASNPAGCLSVDGTSEVRLVHVNCQPFASSNASGIIVSNGGIAHMTMGETMARGAGFFCYNFNTSGVFVDDGDNKCTINAGATIYNGTFQPATFSMTANGTTQLGGRQTVLGAAPTCSVTGAGTTGTCALDTGSTDASGVLTITPGGTGIAALGTFTITYTTGNGAYGVNGTSCSSNFMNGTGSWNVRAGAPTYITQSTTSDVANWDNNAVALTSGSTYKVTYTCYGK